MSANAFPIRRLSRPCFTGAATLGYGVARGPALPDASALASCQDKRFDDGGHPLEVDDYVTDGLTGITGTTSWVLNIAEAADPRAATGAFGSNPLATADYFPLRPRTIALRMGVSF